MNDITTRDKVISDIYESCFSQVSDSFLGTVARVIVEKTGTQTVIIHRLLTYKEYIDLKYNDGCPHVQLIGQDNDTSDEEDIIYSPLSNRSITGANQKNKVEFLFIKGSYSKQPNSTL